MPQQYPYGSSNDKFKKKLFVDTGFGYVEVKARIVEPYSPPTPQPNIREIKILNAPSHLMNMGLSGYRASLTLLFPDKQSWAEYLMYIGWTHKFYDERGAMYLGTVEAPKITAKEASKKYMVEITLILIKKDAYDRKHRYEYQDIGGHWAQGEIEEMADCGLLAVVMSDGQPVLYFKPDVYITRAEYVTFLNRTRRFLERIIRE